MKKMNILFFALALAVSSATGFAQNVKFGVKGGLNLSMPKIVEKSTDGESKTIDTKLSPWFYAGGFAELGFESLEKVKIQASLLYSGNVSKFEKEIIGTDTQEYTFRTHQLTMPLVGKYYIIENMAVSAGGYASYVMDIEGKTGDTKYVSIPGDSYKKFDAGLSGGVEYHFAGGLFVDASYNYGFIDIDSTADNYNYNRFVQFGLGYRF